MSKASVVLVEETPRLRLNAVAALRDGTRGFLGHYRLDNSDISVHVTRLGDTLLIGGSSSRSGSGSGIQQTIELVRVQQTFGWATYFARPDGPGRCTALFLVGDKFVTSATCKLAYASQRLSPAARKKQTASRIVDRLVTSPLRGDVPGARRAARVTKLAGLADFNDERARAALEREQRRGAPLKLVGPPASRKEANLGSTLMHNDFRLGLAINYAAPAVTIPSSGLSRVSLRYAPKRGAPELQMRKLMVNGEIPPRWRHWWDVNGGLLVHTWLDPRDASGMTLRVDICVSGSPITILNRQEIRLTAGSRRGDRFFRCPVTGQRALTLFFREGRFASAFAQKLRFFAEGEFSELGQSLAPVPAKQKLQPSPAVSEPEAKQPVTVNIPAEEKPLRPLWVTPQELREKREREERIAAFDAFLKDFRK